MRSDTPPMHPSAEYEWPLHVLADVCETPIAVLALVERGKVRVVSAVGAEPREVPAALFLETLKCPRLHVVAEGGAGSAAKDLSRALGTTVGYYAGVPLAGEDGERVGVLCVVDEVPRALGPKCEGELVRAGRAFAASLAVRRRLQDLEQRLNASGRSGGSLGPGRAAGSER